VMGKIHCSSGLEHSKCLKRKKGKKRKPVWGKVAYNLGTSFDLEQMDEVGGRRRNEKNGRMRASDECGRRGAKHIKVKGETIRGAKKTQSHSHGGGSSFPPQFVKQM